MKIDSTVGCSIQMIEGERAPRSQISIYTAIIAFTEFSNLVLITKGYVGQRHLRVFLLG